MDVGPSVGDRERTEGKQKLRYNLAETSRGFTIAPTHIELNY